jgi:hypothetical protein
MDETFGCYSNATAVAANNRSRVPYRPSLRRSHITAVLPVGNLFSAVITHQNTRCAVLCQNDDGLDSEWSPYCRYNNWWYVDFFGSQQAVEKIFGYPIEIREEYTLSISIVRMLRNNVGA